MNKARAIELLGGSVTTAAEAIGCTSSAISQWPDELPDRLEDRVLAALVRTGRPIPPDLVCEPNKQAA